MCSGYPGPSDAPRRRGFLVVTALSSASSTSRVRRSAAIAQRTIRRDQTSRTQRGTGSRLRSERISGLSHRHAALEASIAVTEQDRATLRAELATLQAELAALREPAHQAMQAAAVTAAERAAATSEAGQLRVALDASTQRAHAATEARLRALEEAAISRAELAAARSEIDRLRTEREASVAHVDGLAHVLATPRHGWRSWRRCPPAGRGEMGVVAAVRHRRLPDETRFPTTEPGRRLPRACCPSGTSAGRPGCPGSPGGGPRPH